MTACAEPIRGECAAAKRWVAALFAVWGVRAAAFTIGFLLLAFRVSPIWGVAIWFGVSETGAAAAQLVVSRRLERLGALGAGRQWSHWLHRAALLGLLLAASALQ